MFQFRWPSAVALVPGRVDRNGYQWRDLVVMETGIQRFKVYTV